MKELTRSLLLFSLVIAFAGSASAAGTTEYESGVQAFKAGHYGQALQHFEAARRQGNASANLTYNLAVTCYKLKRYDQSERLFRQLKGNPRYRDIARYNLGRIAMRRGNATVAARRFREVRRTSHNEKLRYLAGEALKKLGYSQASGTPAKDWLVLLNAGGGYNDNPLAFPGTQQAPVNAKSDSFMEFLGYGQKYLDGRSGHGLRLYGFAFTKQYMSTSIVDVTLASIGLARENTYGDWQYEYGGNIGHSQVDGHTLTNRLQGDFRLARSFGENKLSLTYRPAYHDAGGHYSYLNGWQHKVDLRWRRRIGNLRWTARYRFEYNSRDNLKTATTYLSFSPLRNAILLEADWHVMPDLTLTAGGKYSHSDYSGTNRLTDVDGVFKVKKRKSNRIEGWIKGEYEFTPHWRLRAEYDYTRDNENLKLYDYSSNEIKALVEFSY